MSTNLVFSQVWFEQHWKLKPGVIVFDLETQFAHKELGVLFQAPMMVSFRATSDGRVGREPSQKGTSTTCQSYKAPKFLGSLSHLISHEVPGKSAWKWILALSLPYQFLLCHLGNPNLAPYLKSKYNSSFMQFFHSSSLNEQWNKNKVSTNHDLYFLASSSTLLLV